jgi:Mannosidase Ig/CBM-like domain
MPDGSVELWLTNDTLAEIEDDLKVRLGTFDGEKIWEENLKAHTHPQTPVSPSPAGAQTGHPALPTATFR